MLLLSQGSFIAFIIFGFEKGSKNGKQSTTRPDLNAKHLNGIVISYNRSIIIDDGNLHTWFMPHNFSIIIPSLTHSPSLGNLRSFLNPLNE